MIISVISSGGDEDPKAIDLTWTAIQNLVEQFKTQ